VLQLWRKIKKSYKRNNTAGFLLVQIGIVLALLVVIVTISISNTTLLRKHMVHAQVEKLELLFRYFQQKACATQTEQKLIFDERTSTYYAVDSFKETLPAGIQFGFLNNVYGPPSSPKTLIHKGITFNNNTVMFSPDGSISSGTLYLIDAEKNILYALTAPISHISFLRIYRYDERYDGHYNGKWVCLS
jgi:hypothetical protein